MVDIYKQLIDRYRICVAQPHPFFFPRPSLITEYDLSLDFNMTRAPFNR